MVDQQQPNRRLIGQYALIGALVMAAALAGVIAGRALGASGSNTQFPSGNEITLPSGGLLFKSREGKLVAKLDVDEGGGFLIIYNASQKPILTMGGSAYGGGHIGLTSGKGLGASLQLSGTEDGGRVSLVGKYGKQVVLLGSGDDGGEIEVSDGGGKIVWSTPASARP
ncbi:MAG TPA: hypothetical protein VGJ37_11450 [Pyrinomonadaceae bacterium]|jgi:hypothetical protein